MQALTEFEGFKQVQTKKLMLNGPGRDCQRDIGIINRAGPDLTKINPIRRD